MLEKAVRYLTHLKTIQRINLGLSRGAVTSATRLVDLHNPISWEFSALSQNGEDGILDVLLSQLKQPNRYFIEIGASNGIENNTAYLAIAKKFSGLMVEGDSKLAKQCESITSYLCPPQFVNCTCMFVTPENVQKLKHIASHLNPDIFSLDIDGNDYYVAEAILSAGFAPKIIVVEYNSAFGPNNSLTIQYKEDFNWMKDSGGLYYGVAVSAWKRLFSQFGYKFVTVDSNGINAFFVNPDSFNDGFLENIRGLHFAENVYQFIRFKGKWEKQFREIESKSFFNA
jgi:hypothetical protein